MKWFLFLAELRSTHAGKKRFLEILDMFDKKRSCMGTPGSCRHERILAYPAGVS